MSTILKNLIVIAMTSSAIAAQASWDVTVGSNNNEYLYASADSFAADGNLRFARQMTSTDTPDANGFLYVETIAQFNCTKKPSASNPGMTTANPLTACWALGAISRMAPMSKSF